MKVSVSYGDRTYGNAIHSKASEINISGSSSNVCIRIDYKKPMVGRGLNWVNAGSVGGAEIEMSLTDALALAEALTEFSLALDNYNPFEETMYARLRIRDGHKPQHKIIKVNGLYFTVG